MYTFNSRVRYSEVGMKGYLSPDALVNYFQDSSTFQSEDIGLGLESLREKQRVWILNAWQIEVNRYPGLGEIICIKTWPHGFHGFFGDRNFLMEDSKGNVLAYANSLWVFMDTKTGRPCRVSQEEIDGYILEPEFDMEYADRKVILPKEYSILETFSILPHQIDTNNHVNNGQYIRMAADYIPVDFKVKSIRAEYKKSAVLGDFVVPKIYQTKQCIVIALCDTTEQPYAVIELKS